MSPPRIHRALQVASVLVLAGLGACAQPVDQGVNAHASSSSSGSCQGVCGSAPDDGSCYCDDQCDSMGDCCSDFTQTCGGGSAGTGGGPAAGGGSGYGGSGGSPPSGNGGSGGTVGVGSSCAGHCGAQSADGSCWCDDVCAQNGNCCADATAMCGMGSGGTSGSGGATGGIASCVGHCGGPSADGSCWCDTECQASGDCCGDVASACSGGTPTSGGCTLALCNSATPSTENGMECYCNESCQQYGDCCSNAVQVCSGP